MNDMSNQPDSAFYYYSLVLEHRPNNVEALAGLMTIADRYVALAQKALKRNQLDKANTYIRRGLTVVPEHQELLALQQQSSAQSGQRSTSGLLDNLGNFFKNDSTQHQRPDPQYSDNSR